MLMDRYPNQTLSSCAIQWGRLAGPIVKNDSYAIGPTTPFDVVPAIEIIPLFILLYNKKTLAPIAWDKSRSLLRYHPNSSV